MVLPYVSGLPIRNHFFWNLHLKVVGYLRKWLLCSRLHFTLYFTTGFWDKLLVLSRMKKYTKNEMIAKPSLMGNPWYLIGSHFQGKKYIFSEFREKCYNDLPCSVTEIITIFVSEYKAKSVSVMHPTLGVLRFGGPVLREISEFE